MAISFATPADAGSGRREGSPAKGRLLLVTHVAIRQGEHGAQIDDQTAAGIVQWCRYFDSVSYYGIQHDSGGSESGSINWVDIGSIEGAERAIITALPRAYRISAMAGAYHAVRAQLRGAIAKHETLCFTIGGISGDWPAIGALEAQRQGRRYAAWLDRVEPAVIRSRLEGASFRKRLFARITLPWAERLTNHIVRKSTVALLQGQDTFDYYAHEAPNPHCTYDTHTHSSDQITPDCVRAKIARIENGAPLRIIYVGRAAVMKGPRDWIDALAYAQSQDVSFHATWIGDGPELSSMKHWIQKTGLAQKIDLPGFRGGRDGVFPLMRQNDIMLFCHKTQESPRCLIEALVAGCALVGYDTAYPRGLVQWGGGGAFAPRGDIQGLGRLLVSLDRDRKRLSKLVADAATSGETYTEEAVYGHRARLMRLAREDLPPAGPVRRDR